MDPITLKKNWEDGMVLDKTILNADATSIETVINKLLTSVTDSDSGGDAIKMTPITGVGNSGTDTVQKVSEALKSLIDGLVIAIQNTTLGQILDGTISAAKLDFDVATQAELDALSGVGNTHTVKEAYDLASAAQVISLLTNAGDILGRDSEMLVRIAKGAAYQVLGMNSGATAQQYMASLQSLIVAAGDLIYGSAANTPARLAFDNTANKALISNGSTLAYGYPKNVRYQTSDTVIVSANTERWQSYSGSFGFYHKKGFVSANEGTVRIRLQAKSTDGQYTAIVITNSARGQISAPQGTYSTTYVDMYFDVGIPSDKIINVEIGVNVSGSVYIRNVTMCADIVSIESYVAQD